MSHPIGRLSCFRHWLRDLWLGGRAVFRTPASALASIVTIAVVVGSTATIGSALSTVLLRPLPAPSLDRIVAIQGAVPALRLRDTTRVEADIGSATNRPRA